MSRELGPTPGVKSLDELFEHAHLDECRTKALLAKFSKQDITIQVPTDRRRLPARPAYPPAAPRCRQILHDSAMLDPRLDDIREALHDMSLTLTVGERLKILNILRRDEEMMKNHAERKIACVSLPHLP